MGLLDFITGGDKKNDGKGTPQGGSQNTKPVQGGYQSALPTMQGNIPFVGTGAQQNPAPGTSPVFPPQQFQPVPQQINPVPQPTNNLMNNPIQPMDPVPGYQPTPTSDPNSMQVEQEVGDGSLEMVDSKSDLAATDQILLETTEPMDPMLNSSGSTKGVVMPQDNLGITEPTPALDNLATAETDLLVSPEVDLTPQIPGEDTLESQPASELVSESVSELEDQTESQLASQPQPEADQLVVEENQPLTQSSVAPEASEIQDSSIEPNQEPKADLPGFNFDPSKLDFSKFNLPTNNAANTTNTEPEMLSSEPLVDTAMEPSITEPLPTTEASIPMPEVTTDETADQISPIELAPQKSSAKKIYNKAILLGLTGSSPEVTVEGTKGLVVELLNNNIEVSIDSENAVSAELLKVAEELGKEIQGIYLKPLVANQDVSEMDFPALGNKSTVLSNYLEWVKEIVKSSNLFIFLNNPSVQNHALLLTLISLSKMYGEKGKRVILYGDWQDKVQSLIQADVFSQEEISNVSIVTTPTELTTKISELDASFATTNVTTNKVADKRMEGDEEDYIVGA